MNSILPPLFNSIAEGLNTKVQPANVVAISSHEHIGQAVERGWYAYQTLPGIELATAWGVALANHHTTCVVVASTDLVVRDIQLLSQIAGSNHPTLIICPESIMASDLRSESQLPLSEAAIWLSSRIPFIARYLETDHQGLVDGIESWLAYPRLAVIELVQNKHIKTPTIADQTSKSSALENKWLEWQAKVNSGLGILCDLPAPKNLDKQPTNRVALVDEIESTLDINVVAGLLADKN